MKQNNEVCYRIYATKTDYGDYADSEAKVEVQDIFCTDEEYAGTLVYLGESGFHVQATEKLSTTQWLLARIQKATEKCNKAIASGDEKEIKYAKKVLSRLCFDTLVSDTRIKLPEDAFNIMIEEMDLKVPTHTPLTI